MFNTFSYTRRTWQIFSLANLVHTSFVFFPLIFIWSFFGSKSGKQRNHVLSGIRFLGITFNVIVFLSLFFFFFFFFFFLV
ncbi:hypothetical protein QBC44DRAFT_323762, partial [Cladorrhinum sp. PSN332]